MSQLMIKPGAEYPRADARDRLKTSGYLVVIEAGNNGWGAYVPDLPGVVAGADTEDEVRELISEAVEFHLEGLRAEGEPVPEPVSTMLWVAS